MHRKLLEKVVKVTIKENEQEMKSNDEIYW